MLTKGYKSMIVLLVFITGAVSQVSNTGHYEGYIRQPTLLSYKDAFYNIPPPPRLHDKNKHLLKPYRFAKAMPISVPFDHTSIATINGQGDWRWRIELTSVGAVSLSLIFDQWWIPEHSEVYVYNHEVKQ